jgi:hypothetical protein
MTLSLVAQKLDGGNAPRPILIIVACPEKLRAYRPDSATPARFPP